MVKHHQKKKKKASRSRKDGALREREQRLRNIDQFAGSSDEDEEGGHSDGATTSAAAAAATASAAATDSSSEAEDDFERNKPTALGKRASGVVRKDAGDNPSSDEDGDEYGEGEFGAPPPPVESEAPDDDDDAAADATDDDEMESADEFAGGDSSISAIASKSAGMAGAMARILGSGFALQNDHKQSEDKKRPAPTASKGTGSVVLSKTVTPLQRLQQKQKTADAATRAKRRLRRDTNLTAMHIPLSAATSIPLLAGGKSGVAIELEQERAHRRVATRGVVALFNAITKHQQKMKEDEQQAGISGSTAKKKGGQDDVQVMSKRGFLDMLKTNATKAGDVKGGATDKAGALAALKQDNASASSGEKKSGSGWNALKDDFMMKSKLKDWDKDLSDDSSEESNDEEEAHVAGDGEVNDDWSDDEGNAKVDGKARVETKTNKRPAGSSGKSREIVKRRRGGVRG
jgi:hypothetical protein